MASHSRRLRTGNAQDGLARIKGGFCCHRRGKAKRWVLTTNLHERELIADFLATEGHRGHRDLGKELFGSKGAFPWEAKDAEGIGNLEWTMGMWGEGKKGKRQKVKGRRGEVGGGVDGGTDSLIFFLTGWGLVGSLRGH